MTAFVLVILIGTAPAQRHGTFICCKISEDNHLRANRKSAACGHS